MAFWHRKKGESLVNTSLLPSTIQPGPSVQFGWGYACEYGHTTDISYKPFDASKNGYPEIRICAGCGKKLSPAVLKATYEYQWRDSFGPIYSSTKHMKWMPRLVRVEFYKFMSSV
jgi:hypothetical protein